MCGATWVTRLVSVLMSDIDLSEFEQPQRLPNVTYELPPAMAEADPALEELYNTMVGNLQLEAMAVGRPLSVYEQILMERVAFNYCFVRYGERSGDFGKQTTHQQAQKFWLEVSKEFEERVKGTESESLARIVKGSFGRALIEIPDKALREQVSVRFSDGLRDAGM